MSKSRPHSQKFNDRYIQEFDYIRKSRKGDFFALCTVCNLDINISHGGKTDITAHSRSKKHIFNFNNVSQSSKLPFVFKPNDDFKTIKAEVLFTCFVIEHNIPIAAADHFSKLLPIMYPNCEDIKKFSCGRTKMGHIIKEIASDSTRKVTDILLSGPFSVATDGSHDTDTQMYPIVVTFFDFSTGQISSKLLSLPCLEGSSTGENIANLIIKEFDKLKIPFSNCISLGSDNAYTMIGKKKGVYAFLKQKQTNLISVGCLCHLLNLCAEKGAATLPISFDELLVDIYYYFHQSIKRKNVLKNFQSLYNVEQKKILKHGMTRWLSLGKCLSRLLEQWHPLLMYFKEECNKVNIVNVPVPVHDIKSAASSRDGKCEKKTLPSTSALSPSISIQATPPISVDESSKKRKKNIISKTVKKSKNTSVGEKISKTIKKDIPSRKVIAEVKKSKSNSLNKTSNKNRETVILQREERIFLSLSSYLYHAFACFLKNIICVFDTFNTQLQSEVPRVHKLKSDLESFFKELLHRFIKTDVIVHSNNNVFDIEYENVVNHKHYDDITIGSQAREILKSLSSDENKLFFDYVKKYFTASCDYFLSSFPIHSDVFKNAEVADIAKRESASFSSVKYFINQFPCLLLKKGDETVYDALDKLEMEFLKYQTFDFSQEMLAFSRIDEQWELLRNVKGPLGELIFERLCKVMLGILVLPHSNASCERIFSSVRRNKTDFRSSMQPEMLEAILVAKSRMSVPCYSQDYDVTFLKKAKSATTVALNK